MNTKIVIPSSDDTYTIDEDVVNTTTTIDDNSTDSVTTDTGSTDTSNTVNDTPVDNERIAIDETVDNEQIEIDGVIYNVDNEGNALDNNGNIKYSKSDISKFDLPDTELNLNQILELTNIKPVDDKGNFVEYEQTPEGIAKYVSDVYEIASQQAIQEFQNNLFSKYPILSNVINHLSLHNSLEGFDKQIDYSSIELQENNELQLTNVIKEARKLRGESDEKVEKYINYLKDSNSLYSEAQEELNFLVAKDSEFKESQAKDIELKQQQELKDSQEYWGIAINDKGQIIDLNKSDSIYGIIKSGKINIGDESYTIPEKIRVSKDGKVVYKSRNDFFNYLYNPIEVVIDNNKVQTTEYQLDMYNKNSSRKVSDDVFDAFKQFVNYDTSQFIKENFNRQEVKKVIKKISTKPNRQSPHPETGSVNKIVIPKHD